MVAIKSFVLVRQSPRRRNAACGFPALRAPICFAPRLMGPIRPGQLSVQDVALLKISNQGIDAAKFEIAPKDQSDLFGLTL